MRRDTGKAGVRAETLKARGQAPRKSIVSPSARPHATRRDTGKAGVRAETLKARVKPRARASISTPRELRGVLGERRNGDPRPAAWALLEVRRSFSRRLHPAARQGAYAAFGSYFNWPMGQKPDVQTASEGWGPRQT
jgi:hypothetical protein